MAPAISWYIYRQSILYIYRESGGIPHANNDYKQISAFDASVWAVWLLVWEEAEGEGSGSGSAQGNQAVTK